MNEVQQDVMTTLAVEPAWIQRFRRQLTGTGNWRRAVSRSDLPADIQTTILKLVGKTRLMKFEKSEIADELIAHLHDGFSQGQSWEMLAKHFGDVNTAAKLFESTKRQARPKIINAGTSALWTLAMMVIGYLVLFAYFNSSRPNPSVDYVAEYNRATLAVPEDHRAWPVYRDAWTTHEFCGTVHMRFDDFFVKDEEGQSITSELARPGDKEWPNAVAHLQELDDLVAAFREGARLKQLGLALHANYYGYAEEDFVALYPGEDYHSQDSPEPTYIQFGMEPFSDDANDLMADASVSVLLPHVQQFRAAAYLFIVDTRLAIKQDDLARTIESMVTGCSDHRFLNSRPGFPADRYRKSSSFPSRRWLSDT